MCAHALRVPAFTTLMHLCFCHSQSSFLSYMCVCVCVYSVLDCVIYVNRAHLLVGIFYIKVVKDLRLRIANNTKLYS